jgi:uncharacterized protein YkwD
MRTLVRTLCLASLVSLVATACISISTPPPINSTPLFVTATLPPTRTPAASPTTETTPTVGTPIPTGSALANCKDLAVLVQDVTIPDLTNLPYGDKFTKTWQLRNTGGCLWSGYTIAYVSGDRLAAPDSAPVPQTGPKSNVNVSVDLVAPSVDGTYTGFFELRNQAGRPLAIGTEKTFWVKITVGHVTPPTQGAATSAVPTTTGALTTPGGPLSCKYTVSGSYPGDIIALINQARTGAGLPALMADARLGASAQNHSIDMACHGLLSHTGSDGSSPSQRIVASGYGASFSEEMIYGGSGAYPQTAFDWWMSDPTHHDVIFDSRATDVGAGFAHVAGSSYRDYYTVDLGSH